MLKRFLKPLIIVVSTLAVLLIALVVLFMVTNKPTPVDTASPIGLTEAQYTDEERSRQLELYVWYPTDETTPVELFEDNAAFRGFSAIKDAPVADATYPLVVLSHGSGGNRANQGWLAVELARQGAIVVAMNHPGSTSRDSAAATNILTWNRPADVSFVLDSLLKDSQFSPHIDSERVAVVGHSLGGYTALAVGGAELSLENFIAYCDEFPNNPDCIFYREGDVDLTQVERSKFERSNRDERVKAVVAIDPAYARSFQAESLDTLTDTLLIAPTVEAGEADLQVSYLAEQLAPEHDLIELAGAQHFTFLPECKAAGYYLLMVVERGGEVLCKRERGETRAEYHSEVATQVIDFLQMNGVLNPPQAGRE